MNKIKILTNDEKNKILHCIDWCIRDGIDSEDDFKTIKEKLNNPKIWHFCQLQGSYHKELIYDEKSNMNVCKGCLELMEKFR